MTSLSLPANEADELEQGDANTDTDAELNGEKQEATHNLSAVGPALPLASIVNKIKINITKNTSSNSHNSASNTTTTDSQVSAISVIGGSGAAGGASGAGDPVQQVNAIQTISTIPVLCGGNTFVPKIATSTPSNVISSISVIGSTYGASSSSNGSRSTTSTASSAPAASLLAETGSLKSPTPPLATVDPDPEPVVEQKPALRNATLKRTKKVQNGIETSGLCSIM